MTSLSIRRIKNASNIRVLKFRQRLLFAMEPQEDVVTFATESNLFECDKPLHWLRLLREEYRTHSSFTQCFQNSVRANLFRDEFHQNRFEICPCFNQRAIED